MLFLMLIIRKGMNLDEKLLLRNWESSRMVVIISKIFRKRIKKRLLLGRRVNNRDLL